MEVMSELAMRAPRLAFDVVLGLSEGAVVIDHGDDVVEITGLDTQTCRRALNEMRGDRTLPQISAASGVAVQDLEALCRGLETSRLLEFVDPARSASAATDLVSPSATIALFDPLFVEWKRRLFAQPLWTGLTEGSAPRSVFLGWLIENYFFIEAATARLPVAIAGCDDLAARRLFAKHFSEEFDHHHFFSRALEAAGVDQAALSRRTPLPSTLAVRNHMRACGRRDPLAYAACSGFLESTGDDHVKSHAFFARIAAHFDGENAPVVGPLAEHARLDEAYQHCGMLKLIAEALGPVSRARVEAALQAARLLMETLEVWSFDIWRHYQEPDSLATGVRRYRPLRYEQVLQ